MNNFGVIEVASTKTTHAPGWAYVPDTPASAIPSQSVSAVHLHVNRNKRAARNNNAAAGSVAASSFAVNERHDAKLQKEIEQLQRDSLGGRDAQIPIPSGGQRDKDGKIRGHTANVRKILASQKTFANHLDDFDAWSRTQGEGGTATGGSAGHSAAGTPAPSGTPATAASGAGASKKGSNNHTTGSTAQKRAGTSSSSARAAKSNKSHQNKTAAAAATATPDADISMTDAPSLAAAEDDTQNQSESKPAAVESQILTPFTRFTPPSHPGDADPLLESWLPPLPTDDELRELMRAPPLTYHQARGVWTEDDKRYPTRHFCEVCGYWGRVRCMKCGTKVCALDCLDVHREECLTRYGL